ncbi:hypothetical protein IHN32_00570 [Deinococcus sp. 14RED07]|uniref:hypothetical protein n=1 Tax=Deinococcus sp. 14RED07 TaxID=2745874 RepID=UPI001E30A1B5|nr:hypothetical protein [Deinococcus sp. 14RED07]MCD0174450.1 hypothetical protein [Deinococcus sp. 14RED07]
MNKTLNVSDVVQPDTSTQFISDVQLSTFYDDKKLNHDLMTRFLFTRGTGGKSERKGTADLLRTLHQSVTAIGATADNRFVFMATYGHGKSHLGLAIANYFGALQGSPELEIVLQKLEHALPTHEAQAFRDFRDNPEKAPFLVLVLHGDRPGGLRDNFFRALDKALSQSEVAKEAKPPFWFDKADELLANLEKSPSDAAKANAYLKTKERDLASVRQEIKERQSSAYELATGAFRAVHGVTPNIGGETALNDAVAWIVTDLCGPGKPFGGLLVLFDEFSRFILDYTQSNPVGAPLQELLGGISHPSARGKALFVGLSQHDPNTIAEKYRFGEELIKELNRLPAANRHIMQTRLEDVLGGVLKTSDSAWAKLMNQPSFALAVSEASDTARMLFSNRYGSQQLNWDMQTVMDKVAKQCFPMHPLTTAFLSSVTLHSSGTVRSVLGFIQDEKGFVMPRFAESAQTDGGQPNWVMPTRLVDYFGSALGEDKYNDFKNVIKPDLTDVQQEVLKAILLLDLAELPTKQAGGYAAVIANLTGVEEGEAKRTLQLLVDQHYIRYDSANKTYSFWVGSNGALDLDRMLGETINQRLEDKKLAVLFETFTGGTNAVNKLGLGKQHEVAVIWGSAGDWAAQEVLVPASGLKPELLTALRNKYAVPIDCPPEMRGVVVLVIPKTQQEVEQAPERIRQLLQQSTKDHAAPLLFLVAREGLGDLQTNLLKLALLNDLMFKNLALPKVGETVLEEVRISLTSKVQKILEDLRMSGELIVPPAMQLALEARLKPRSPNRIGEALKVVYELAYPHHPDSFFTQYGMSSTNLNKAVVDVIYELLENSLDRVSWSASAKVPGEVVKVLQKDWGIISPQQQIVDPKFTKVKVAWDRFEGTFSPKIKSAYANKVLLELLQAPYGYDQNTLALLFAAWLGRNRDAVYIKGIGKLNRPPAGAKSTLKNAGQFLKLLVDLEIHRKDTESERVKAQAVLTQLKDHSFSAAEAKKGIYALEEFKNNHPNYDSTFLEQADDAVAKLQKGLANQEAYDKAVDAFEARLSQARSVAQIDPLAKGLKAGFPSLTVVASDKIGIADLQKKLLTRAEQLTRQEIAENTTLRDFGAYTKQMDALKGLAKALYQLGLPDLKTQADAAQETLSQAKQQLEAQQAEASELSVVNSIAVTGSLAGLRTSFEAVRTFDPKSNKANELANEKYQLLKERIAHFEGQLPAWTTELDEVADHQTATQLNHTLLAQSAHYEGTPEAEQLSGLQKRATALGRYFDTLSAMPKLHEPADVAARHAVLLALAEEHQTWLTEDQRALISGALEDLKIQEDKLQADAKLWLEARRQKFSEGQVGGLEQELDAPPRFLSDADRAVLGELRAALRSKLDAAAQQEQQLKLIAAVPQTGSLLTLQGSLNQLKTQVFLPGQVSAVAEQRLGQLQDEIDRLSALPVAWAGQLAEASDLKAIEELSRDLTRQEAKFEGTSFAERVRDLSQQVRAVGKVFSRAGELRGLKSSRLSDLAEREKEQQTLLHTPGLSPAHQQALEKDIKATRQLFADQIALREKELHGYTARLEQAKTVPELDQVDLGRFPRAGLPEALAEELQQLEQRKTHLRESLSDLQDLGKTPWPSLAEAHGLLERYTQLLQAPHWSEAQRQHLEQKRATFLTQVQGKRDAASGWLSECQKHLTSLDGQGLAKLQAELERSHPFLSAQDGERLNALRSDLHQRLQEDQALQIEMLFSQIDSRRRAALLERLQSMASVDHP